jgi:hypothetical protein|tara:strand:+ start:1625 stop:2134 length:510 start_codon:yes stop_codon:yes gene_type:complete
MIKISEKRRTQSWADGNASAKRYVEATPDARKSTKEEDMYMHVDFWHGSDGVDVKGNNHLDEIWIEFRNVLGKKGWLIGDAKWIAFEVCEIGGFARVERLELLNWCLENVDMELDLVKDRAYRKLYQRLGRRDKIAKLALHDLQELNSYTVIPYRTSYISPRTEESISI